MNHESFDAIVIGAGQAGPAIAARCSREGLRTAIIERGDFGGTCVNVGCVPTKTLVASARAIHVARRGAEFGFATGGDITVDMLRVKARKDAIVLQSRNGVLQWMQGLKHTEVIHGAAHFTAPGTLQVGARTLSAPRCTNNCVRLSSTFVKSTMLSASRRNAVEPMRTSARLLGFVQTEFLLVTGKLSRAFCQPFSLSR